MKFLFLRDGVCEGQFSKVLQAELLAIREACVKVNNQCSNIFKKVLLDPNHFFFPSSSLTTCQGSP